MTGASAGFIPLVFRCQRIIFFIVRAPRSLSPGGTFLLSALVVALLIPSRPIAGFPIPRGKTVSIAVDYGGSWKLRYKLYYHEIADSEVRELYGFGQRVVPVSADRELVNVCAWLTPTGVEGERERLRLRIVVDDGAVRVERESPRSLFSKTSSICFHF